MTETGKNWLTKGQSEKLGGNEYIVYTYRNNECWLYNSYYTTNCYLLQSTNNDTWSFNDL